MADCSLCKELSDIIKLVWIKIQCGCSSTQFEDNAGLFFIKCNRACLVPFCQSPHHDYPVITEARAHGIVKYGTYNQCPCLYKPENRVILIFEETDHRNNKKQRRNQLPLSPIPFYSRRAVFVLFPPYLTVLSMDSGSSNPFFSRKRILVLLCRMILSISSQNSSPSNVSRISGPASSTS